MLEKQVQVQPVNELIDEMSKKLKIDPDVARKITPEEIHYLLDHCPFLQMVDTHASYEPVQEEVRIVTAESSNWDVHDYGDALCSSPGKFIFGGGFYHLSDDDDDDAGGSGIVNPGKGTVYNQAFQTACEMVKMAVAHGWGGLRIVDGHPMMIRAAWIKASQQGLAVDGYEPTAYDHSVRERIALSSTEFEVLRQQVRMAAR